MASVKAPPHGRAGQDGRGHRFAAYPRCSADALELLEVIRERGGALLSLGFVLAVAGTALGGSPFSSIQDSFVALFPTPPYVESHRVAVGERSNANLRMYRVDEAKTAWLVSATDVAGLTVDVKRTLAGAREGMVAKSGGKVMSERSVRIGQYEGLSLRLERPDKSIIRARLCVTPRRIYEVIVMTTEESLRLSQIQRFLDSFSPE